MAHDVSIIGLYILDLLSESVWKVLQTRFEGSIPSSEGADFTRIRSPQAVGGLAGIAISRSTPTNSRVASASEWLWRGALANDPPLVLADEPTGSLDSKSTEQVFAILQTLVRERGKTIIAVTHDTGLAGRMDRRLELTDGRLIADVWQEREGVPHGAVETTLP